MSLDSVGKLRISNSHILENYKVSEVTNISNLDEDILIQLNSVANSTLTYNSNNYIEIETSDNSSYALMTSKCPLEYITGRSRFIMMSGVLLDRSINGEEVFESQFGMFDVDSSTPPIITNGVCYKTDGTTLQFSDVSKSSATTVTQANWNIDVFDGSGSSGETLTVSSAETLQLMYISQLWNGGGAIEVGFIIDNILCPAHLFTHNSLTSQYTPSPQIRACYYLNSTTISSSLSQRMMAYSNFTEGTMGSIGKKLAFNTTYSGVTLATAGTNYVLLALRLKSGFTSSISKLLNISGDLEAISGSSAIVQVQLHSTYGSVGTVNGTLSFSSVSNSSSEVAIGDGTQTITSNGNLISSIVVDIRFEKDFNVDDLYKEICSRYNDTYYDTLILSIISSNNNSKCLASMNYLDII